MNQAGQSTSQPSTIQPSTPQSSSKSPLKAIVIIIVLGLLVGGGFLAFSLLQEPSTTTPKEGVTQYVGSQTIPLSDVSGGTSSGTATRNITKGKSTHSISASLPEPTEGYYQVWTINSENRFKLGRLTRDGQGDFSLETEFNFDSDNPAFSTFPATNSELAVSLETTDDSVMEVKVLQGNFTQ